MGKFIGRQQEVGIAREITRGVLVAPAFWIPKVDFTVEDKVQKGRFQGNYGVLAGGDDALVTQQWSEGELELEVTDQNIGLLLYGLFGTLSSSSFLSAYKHLLSIQNSVQPTTLSLMMNDPIGSTNSKTVAMAKAMINSMELDVELGELIKARFGFMGMPHSDYTRQTPSYSAENKFAHQHLTFKIAANTGALDAASKINLQSLTLRIEKNVIRENALGTVQPVDLLGRNIKITGTIRLTHEDRTYRDYMLDGTKKALRIYLNRSDVTIGSTTPQLKIDLPIVDFFDWESSHPLDDISAQEIQFEALYDVANSELIDESESFVVNATTSY